MEGWTDGWRWWVYRDGGTDGGQAGWIDEWADSWEFRWRRGWMDVSGCKYANMHWEMWKNDYSDTCIVLQSHCEGKIHVSSKRGGGCCTCCIMLPRLVALCQTVRTAAIMTDLWNRTTLKHSSCELTRYSISLLAVSRSRYLEALKNDPTGFFENPSSTGVQHVSHANKNPERLRTTNKVFLDVYVGSEKKTYAGDAWTWKLSHFNKWGV